MGGMPALTNRTRMDVLAPITSLNVIVTKLVVHGHMDAYINRRDVMEELIVMMAVMREIASVLKPDSNAKTNNASIDRK